MFGSKPIKIIIVLAGLAFLLAESAMGEQTTYRIRAAAGGHGTITPRGWVRVSHGASQTFVIQPKGGYEIADVKIDRISVGKPLSYTFLDIRANHRIVATFKKIGRNGQTEFISALPYGGRISVDPPGTPVAPVDDNENNRVIEEGDIVKVYEDSLLVLNRYRGLQMIDITDSANASLLSTVPVYGYPVELFARGGNAYIVVSDYFNYWYSPLRAATESFRGSQIAVVDIRDKGAPKIINEIKIQGFITDTRIVGDILYTASNRYAYSYYGTTDNQSLTTITAISLADPLNIHVVQEMSFPVLNTSQENNVHVTANMIFLAQYGWGYTNQDGNWVQNDATDITCIDISDQGGLIRKGKTFVLPGVVSNRWQMDYYDGYFRAITPEKYWGNGYPSLYIYRVQSPDSIEPVSNLTLNLDRPESLMAVRFDGEAAYAVTYERKDPLFTIDLRDPTHPRQLAEIEMSGWMDYIEPRTDHLVALGHDDAGGMTSLAVTLLDVTNLDTPTLVKRVNFGEGYGWISSEINDMHKAFKVLDALGLILVPFSSWSLTENKAISGVQLLDFFFDAGRKDLVKRGVIDHEGWAERAVSYNDTTVLTVSNESFQTVDITDRDKPEVKRVLELARNALDIAGLTDDAALELSNNNQWYAYAQAKSRLSAIPLDDPNTPIPFDSIEIPGYYEHLFSMKNCNVASGYRYDGQQGGVTLLKTVTYDGSDFSIQGSLEITGLSNDYWIYPLSPSLYYPYMPSATGVKISDTALVYSGYVYASRWPQPDSYTLVMKAVDVSNPSAPRIASTLNIDLQGFPTHTLWDGAKAYISYAVQAGDETGIQYYRYYFKTVDFSDIENPAVSLGINIPGNVVGRSLNGRFVYTIDYQYGTSPDVYTYEVYLNTLEPIDDKAHLRDRERIVPPPVSGNDYYSLGKVLVKNEKAYYVVNHSSCTSDYSTCQYDATLWTADLSTPENILFPASIPLHVQSADVMDSAQTKLFLYTYYNAGGILVYSLSNPLEPSFESFYRTDSYTGKMVVIKNRAYLPSGMYGIKMIELQ